MNRLGVFGDTSPTNGLSFKGQGILLHQGNALAIVPEIAPDSIDAAIFSPPYYRKIDYGSGAGQLGLERTIDAYIGVSRFLFQMLYQAVKPGGALVVNVGDTWNGASVILRKGQSRKEATFTRHDQRREPEPGFLEKEPLNIPERVRRCARGAGWAQRQTWIWDKGFGADHAHGSDRADQTHEYIHYFIKPRRGDRRPKANWFDRSVISQSVIRVPAVSSRLHPCPFPKGLADILVRGVCPPGGTVLDPLMGEGSIPLAARDAGRVGVGIELNPNTFAAICDRCAQLSLIA